MCFLAVSRHAALPRHGAENPRMTFGTLPTASAPPTQTATLTQPLSLPTAATAGPTQHGQDAGDHAVSISMQYDDYLETEAPNLLICSEKTE